MSLIRRDFFISPYQKDKFVLEISDLHFIISGQSKDVLDILFESDSYTTAARKFNSAFSENISPEEFEGFAKSIFSKIPVFEGDVVSTEKQKSFIKFQKPLISASLAGKIVEPLLFLFQKTFFWIAFSILALAGLLLIILIEVPSAEKFPVLWITLLYAPTIFLHELGHIAACRRFVKKNGEIGFGVYFIFPIFYSNISSIWHARRDERVIANLAGVYMQLWCMLAALIAYYFTKNQMVLYMAYMLALYTFVQLIPFIRSDGYWLLSDISSVPNLQSRSNDEVKSWLRSPLQKIKTNTSKDYFVLLYGIFNTLVLVYFVAIQLIYYWKDLLNFPLYIFEMLKNLVLLKFNELYIAPQLVTTVMFYIISFNLIKKAFTKSQKEDE
ncbi:hypothetical protein ASG01_07850 [Chryseobacterium sp. Leaf180]|uniref:hypothetical protein n=1 Tax=Chryseobacterium sp. Leaf180 TaxID=1736289 RepID=UPI0006FEB116|nr:hypothetical protein [Chryseobacterium sp. Leaf180]KQR93768.1 hypothetical protein ASG01_07850 [Chryseobacterium sp. Leaf180]